MNGIHQNRILVEVSGIEPLTFGVQGRRSPNWATPPKMVGLGGLEPPTSRLSGVRSNRLSYKPHIKLGEFYY